MLEALKTIGAVFGVLAFAWKVWDAASSYLHIRLEIDCSDEGRVKARTTVENKGVFSKRVDNALLLIGPESESPIDTINSMKELGVSVYSTNEIAIMRPKADVISSGGRILIPLPFYYSENIAVGDEVLNYTASIPLRTFEPGESYSVRFFLWTAGRYHRSTHDCFTAPKTEPDGAGNVAHRAVPDL